MRFDGHFCTEFWGQKHAVPRFRYVNSEIGILIRNFGEKNSTFLQKKELNRLNVDLGKLSTINIREPSPYGGGETVAFETLKITLSADVGASI